MIYKVSLNGKIYEVEVEKGEAVIKSEFDAALPQAAPIAQAAAVSAAPVAAAAPQQTAAAAATAGATVVNSPLNGSVITLKMSAGQPVKEGDVVLVIEAMKMENEIPASKSGKLGQFFVQKGASVETGAPLFEIL